MALLRALDCGVCGVCGVCCGGVWGAGSGWSVLIERDRRRSWLVEGSGVEMASLGVDPEDAPVLLAVPLRVEISMASGFAAAFNTFALGRVPKGAMFATTPCLSIPASANDGLAGASCGSILWRVRSAGGATGEDEETYHLSKNVLGFCPASATVREAFGVALWGATANGLEYRDREARWAGSLIVSPSLRATSFSQSATAMEQS
jgi:hypothetical protein